MKRDAILGCTPWLAALLLAACASTPPAPPQPVAAAPAPSRPTTPAVAPSAVPAPAAQPAAGAPAQKAPAPKPAAVVSAAGAAPVIAAASAAGAQYVCVTGSAAERRQTAIEFTPRVADLCRRHPEMGPCQYQRELCRQSGGRVFAADGSEVTRATEAEYDKRVTRIRLRGD